VTNGLREYTVKGKAIHRPRLLHDTDFDIIARYEGELRGLINYYKMAVNVGKLYQVKGAMMASLAKTLASKHKRSVTWVMKRYKTTHENGLIGMKVTVERDGKRSLNLNQLESSSFS
jgi:hypothetical protein